MYRSLAFLPLGIALNGSALAVETDSGDAGANAETEIVLPNVTVRHRSETAGYLAIDSMAGTLRYAPGIQSETFGFEPRTAVLKIRGFDSTETGLYRDDLKLSNPGFAVDSAYRSEPEMSLSFQAFPGNGLAAPNHFVAFIQGTPPIESQLLKPLLIDAFSGELVARGKSSLFVDVLLLSRPLHFSDYGGLPLKILWAPLDLIAIVVLLSGLYLWRKNHRNSIESRLNQKPVNSKNIKRIS